MDEHSLAGRINRRALLRGATGAVAGTSVAVLLADDAFAASGDTPSFAGTVIAHPSPESVEIQIPCAERVSVKATSATALVHADGTRATLDDYAVGQAVAVTVDPGQASSRGTVVSARMTPAVLGEAADLDEIRG
jgi:hypothetical protein